MNNIQIFKNEQFGEIRTAANQAGEPMFCLTDVCKALDIVNPRDCKARLKEDGVATTDIIDRLGRKQQATFINEGNLYKCIFQSRKPDAERFQDWICFEVIPSLRKNGYYINRKQVNRTTPTKVRISLEWVKGIKEILNLNDCSTLLMLKQVGEPLGLPTPDYTPSRGQLLSASLLLKQNGFEISVQEFNKKMMEFGYMVELERLSHKGIKHFKSLTEKANGYGENQVSPHNPRETQPLYYTERFAELVGKLH